jgi:AcrR family transcriptional regulator
MATERLNREEKKALTRARLVEAAQTVFARRGFHGATLNEIADQAGLSTGAVYSNFKGKEDLFLALLDESVSRRVDEIREILESEPTPQGQAERLAVQWMEILDHEPEWFRLFIEFWSHALRDPELHRDFTARWHRLRDAIADLVEAQAREAGTRLPLPVQQFATAVIAMGNGFALEKLTDPDAAPNQLYVFMLGSVAEQVARAQA